ncbi:MAG: lysine biosynthesis protein LysW [Candidatus Saelkia tenebricola]|nr:lysine biosynthesis protein LysW [Candidatus Saelkia tenebricola]
MQGITTICPNCGEEIILDFTPSRGEIVNCLQCGESSEVIHTDPLSL